MAGGIRLPRPGGNTLDATREPRHAMPFGEQNAGLPVISTVENTAGTLPRKPQVKLRLRVGLKTSFLLKSGYNWLQLELQKHPIIHIVFRVNIAAV